MGETINTSQITWTVPDIKNKTSLISPLFGPIFGLDLKLKLKKSGNDMRISLNATSYGREESFDPKHSLFIKLQIGENGRLFERNQLNCSGSQYEFPVIVFVTMMVLSLSDVLSKILQL